MICDVCRNEPAGAFSLARLADGRRNRYRNRQRHPLAASEFSFGFGVALRFSEPDAAGARSGAF